MRVRSSPSKKKIVIQNIFKIRYCPSLKNDDLDEWKCLTSLLIENLIFFCKEAKKKESLLAERFRVLVLWMNASCLSPS